MSNMEDSIPEELVESFETFENALNQIEVAMKPLLEVPRTEIVKNCSPLEVAKLDLVSAYSVNSMFWMYLITQGVNPRTHDIKEELGRIKSYMNKVREIEDKKNAPKLQKDTAKRFIRNAMFDLESKKKSQETDTATTDAQQEPVNTKDDDIHTGSDSNTKVEPAITKVEPGGMKNKSGKKRQSKQERSRRKSKKSKKVD